MHEVSVKRLHADDRREYISLKYFHVGKGVEHSITAAYTPEINGISERSK